MKLLHNTKIQNIRILTYNLFMRPPPIKTNQDDYKNQRFDDILNLMDNFDIISFQEMFQTANFRKERIIQAAIQKGFFYWRECEPPSFFWGPTVDSGLLVISKYPIIQSIFESFNVGVLSDSASDKGFIYCKIQIQGSFLHLFNTHLQASYFGDQLKRQLSIKTRLYQFRELLKKIQYYSKLNLEYANDLIILNGDLNMNSLMTPLQVSNQSPLVNESNQNGFHQYEAFMNIFNQHSIEAIDYCNLAHNCHPITFGDGDQILTGQDQSHSKQSLDYIFKLNFKNKKMEQQQNKLKHCKKQLNPIMQTCKVQQFKIKDRKYIQLSDHYGVSIDVQNKPN